MISFIFRTDVHVADKSPVSWKGDYRAEVFASLRQIGDLASQYKVTAVLDGGDFFHVKTPSRNSHGLIIETAISHTNYPCPVYSIEGNHDLTGNNLDTIEQQPLGVLYETGVFRHLREEAFYDDGEDGLEEGFRVRVVGIPYSESRTVREIQELARKQPGDDYLVAIIHALASEDPPDHVEEFFGEPVFRYSDLVYHDGPDVFCFGHWHRDQGIVQLGKTHFVNQGAVSRGALTKENTERIPKVSLIEFTSEGTKTTQIPLKVAPAAEVFDFERKDRQDRETVAINQFVEELEANLDVDADQDVEKTISAMSFAPEVRKRALLLLERART